VLLSGASQLGLKILNITWEDTGRYKGSSVGPNISDMSIQVGFKNEAGAFDLSLSALASQVATNNQGITKTQFDLSLSALNTDISNNYVRNTVLSAFNYVQRGVANTFTALQTFNSGLKVASGTINIPNNFLMPIFSPNIKKANTITKIGVNSIKTEALIGVVIAKPLKNNNMFAATPKTAETAKGSKSFLSLIAPLTYNL
jgi:hypothetical protein